MITRFLLAALAAGLLAGILVTPLQYARVIPLILQAETYEGAVHDEGHHHGNLADAGAAGFSPAGAASGGDIILVHAPAPSGAGEEAGEGASARLFAGRLTGTLLANLVAGAAFALLLLAASLLLNRPVTRANGALWGLAGFAVLSLAPAIGLAPELPAMPAADLQARQIWWCAAVAFSSLGAYLLVLRREPPAKALGILSLLLPHLLGAPAPGDLASPVPPTLAAAFAVAALATAAAFWLVLGVLFGHFSDRLRRTSLSGKAPA